MPGPDENTKREVGRGALKADPATASPSAASLGAKASRRVRLALALLGLAALIYTSHVGLGLIGGPEHIWDHWVYDGVIGGAALLCLLRARVGGERLAWGLIGAALCIYWLGDIYWNNKLSSLADPPYPSWADAGWLIYYLPLYAGLMLLLRARVARLPLSSWLEGIVGALALGSVAATLLFNPVVASTHGDVSTVLTNLAYPTMDVVLLSLLAGSYMVLGSRAGSTWLLLALGLTIAALADSTYLIQAADGTYAEGGLVNAGWPLAFSLMALAAWRPTRTEEPVPVTHDGSDLKLLGAFFALLVSGLLVYDTFRSVPAVAHLLLTLAVLALFARAALASRERQLLARRTVEANTDELTGLANRRRLYEFLDQSIADGRELTLLFIDLNRFLDLTDTLGRSAGDQLIKAVAERLLESIPGETMLARVGDDEFVMVLPASTPRSECLQQARAISEALEAPVPVDGLLLTVRASIGVALTPEHARSRAELMRCADIAMCRARAHESDIELYKHGGEDHGLDQLTLLSELREAFDQRQFVLHYQPKVRVADRTLAGVEVLVRWAHPRHGLLGPDKFIPIVEREGMIRELTLTVLEQALIQQRVWRLGDLSVPVAVNLSPSSLMDTRVAEDVERLVKRYETPPGLLELEITEEAMMRDTTRALAMMGQLGELGVEFSLDDFGTGYSSLEQLRRLPVRTMKIDRSFVMDMTSAPEDEQIVHSIVQLAHGLDLQVVAEGVESEEHLLRLASLECEIAQGYYISRPLPAEELAGWIATRRAEPAARAVAQASERGYSGAPGRATGVV